MAVIWLPYVGKYSSNTKKSIYKSWQTMPYYVWVKLFKAIKSFLELLFISIFVGLKMRSEEKNYNMSRQTDEEGSTTGVKSLRNNTKN